MTTRRFDAPVEGSCKCQGSEQVSGRWIDSPSGPKWQEDARIEDAAPSGGTLDAYAKRVAGDDFLDLGDAGRIERAKARHDAELAEQAKGGVPAGAMVKR